MIENIVLYYQSCGVKVSKNKVERLSGVGVWPVNPSNRVGREGERQNPQETRFPRSITISFLLEINIFYRVK